MDEYAGRLNNFYNTIGLKRLIFPPKLFYGPDALSFLIDQIPASGAIVIADSFLINNETFASIRKKIDANVFYIYNEPRYSDIDAILSKTDRNKPPSAIVAIGGGSTIDTAKAVKAFYIYGKYQRIGYEDRNISTVMDAKTLPLIAVPTTPASGSECSRYYLIFDHDGNKTVSRSWNLIPDYSVLVPDFLKNYPAKAAVLSAFDAFTHMYETLICRNESSPITNEFSYIGINAVIGAMHQIDKDRPEILPGELIEKLQLSAAIGGLVLSNIRTGMIHHAAEQMSSQVKLSHTMSLIVFCDTVMSFYSAPCADKYKKMIGRIREEGTNTISDIQDIIDLWNRLFDHYGISEELRKKMSAVKIDIKTLTEKVFSDRTWVEKESPVPLSFADVSSIVSSSVGRYKK